MFKLLTILVLVILSAVAVFAQTSEPCNLKLSQSPTIRGLRLGMSVAEASAALGVPINTNEVQTRVSFIKSGDEYLEPVTIPDTIRAEYERNVRLLKLGNLYAGIDPSKLNDSIKRNIRAIDVEFFENRLESLFVYYIFQDMRWTGREEFIRDLSNKTKLPQDSWKNVEAPVNSSSLICRDFLVKVEGGTDGVYYSVNVKDSKAQDNISSARRQKWMENKATEDDRKKAFKP